MDGSPIDLITVAKGKGIDKVLTAKIQGQWYTSVHFEGHCDLIRAIATKKQIKEDIIKVLDKDTKLPTQINNIQEILNSAGGIEEKSPEPLTKVTGELIEQMLDKVKRGENLTGKQSGWYFIDGYSLRTIVIYFDVDIKICHNIVSIHSYLYVELPLESVNHPSS